MPVHAKNTESANAESAVGASQQQSQQRKFVYDFSEGNKDLKDLLGGKGANLAEMTNLGLPVPPGFTITTEACKAYLDSGAAPAALRDEVSGHLAALEERMAKKLGQADDPLLVSVRSGAKFSMPGMMDTVLNIGLSDESVHGLAAQSGDERFAWDSYRRLIQMFGDTVLGIDGERFSETLDEAKSARGVVTDVDLTADDLKELVQKFKAIVSEETGRDFPQDPREQMDLAVRAVFDSWNGARARLYRRQERIPHDLGTAVNICSMVFGNLGPDSGTGVAFTRDPASGQQGVYGDYLQNAQGEDVVAGIRNTVPLADLEQLDKASYDQLMQIMETLENHYRDLCDIEFTIERGKLWMLQTRVGKRTAAAAFRIATQLVDQGLIDEAEALQRVNGTQLAQLMFPRFDTATAVSRAPTRSAGASPRRPAPRSARRSSTPTPPSSGRARARRSSSSAARPTPTTWTGCSPPRASSPRAAARPRTRPWSPAAWARPACAAPRSWRSTPSGAASRARTGGSSRRATSSPSTAPPARSTPVRCRSSPRRSWSTSRAARTRGPTRPTSWSRPSTGSWRTPDRVRRLRVRANADNAEDAARARRFGAQGIGLCRTEHMFLGERRELVERLIILADTEEERERALGALLPLQQGDFVELFESMDGLPVTVRLLDPPLHEFLPDITELSVRVALAESRKDANENDLRLLQAVHRLHEQNPMLGLRGVRLGLVIPGLFTMQIRAIAEAAAARKAGGGDPRAEIMIPLVGTVQELELVREEAEQVITEVEQRHDVELGLTLGTMIELPRAALTADQLAECADFFSFGTNDLTQTVWAFSRDDVEASFFTAYLEKGIFGVSPFETIDKDGVGSLVRSAAEAGRATRPDLKLGVCGEHGGDPESVHFFHEVGLDYVSCSPFRIPVARLEAGRAAAAQQHATA